MPVETTNGRATHVEKLKSGKAGGSSDILPELVNSAYCKKNSWHAIGLGSQCVKTHSLVLKLSVVN